MNNSPASKTGSMFFYIGSIGLIISTLLSGILGIELNKDYYTQVSMVILMVSTSFHMYGVYSSNTLPTWKNLLSSSLLLIAIIIAFVYNYL